MAEYRHSNAAKRDLRDIAKYGVTKFGERATRDYLLMLKAVYPTLGERPNPGFKTFILGRRRPLWRVSAGSHVIYYRRVRDYMFIVRILHQSQLPHLHL